MVDLPRGTVAFLFTDVAGSTALWERDRAAMAAAVERHLALLRSAVESRGGVLFKVVGDAAQAAFPTAPQAVAAALDGQRALLAEGWEDTGPLPVRMAVHAGDAAPDGRGDYLAPALNRLARLLAAGHGGQVLLTRAVQQLARGALPEGCALRDLGEHRLRDLLEPERVFQLLHPALPDRFPPLKTLDARPNNLPRQPTPFLGREREAAEVVALLRRKDVQLLTLTGPGGVGKTRLALAAAADLLEDFPDGVFFVPLAALADPALAPAAAAEALGVREDGSRPAAEALRDVLADKATLLVLDNLEHLPGAAPFVADLLAACSGLKALATSRAPLRLRAEREYPVLPLALPPPGPLPPEQWARYGAAELFLARARAVRPGYAADAADAAAVADIVRRLDGLPLAIELAAARARVFPPAALLARLERRLPLLTGGARDAPARQRTLRDAIAWSHDLLDPEERALFRRLAVFAGGCTLEAAEAVANPEGDLDALGGLERLAEHSLLRPEEGPDGEPRFAMLETVREFALEALAAAGEEERTRDAHAAVVLALAAAAGPHLEGPEQGAWAARLAADHANAREAVRWLLGQGRPADVLRLAAAAHWFWFQFHPAEAAGWLDAALAAAGEGAPWRDRADALRAAAQLARRLHAPARAAALLEEELALRRAHGDEAELGRPLAALGAAALERGDPTAARPLLEEGVARLRAAEDGAGLAPALAQLAYVLRMLGDLEGAAARHAEAHAAALAKGDHYHVVLSLADRAWVLAELGELAEAERLAEEALRATDAAGLAHLRDVALAVLADVAMLRGDHDGAAARLREALAAAAVAGVAGDDAYLWANLGALAHRGGDVAGAAAHLREGLERAHRAGQPGALAAVLLALAVVAADRGEARAAARLLGAAEAADPGVALWGRRWERAELERAERAIGGRLGADAAAERDAGRALPADGAVAEARALADRLAAGGG